MWQAKPEQPFDCEWPWFCDHYFTEQIARQWQIFAQNNTAPVQFQKEGQGILKGAAAPRVNSSQPKKISPELSSSGEETAGDDRANPTPDISASNTENEQADTIAVEVPIENADADDGGEWVDDEEDDDYDDVIDLEYHPSFVRNVSKRRRKWEVGWEHLIQAVSLFVRRPVLRSPN